MMQLGGSCGCRAPRWGDPVGVEILPLSREPWGSLGRVKFLGKVAGDFFTGTGGAPGRKRRQRKAGSRPTEEPITSQFSSWLTHRPSCPAWWAVWPACWMAWRYWLVSEGAGPPLLPPSSRQAPPLPSPARQWARSATCPCPLRPHSDQHLPPFSNLHSHLVLESSRGLVKSGSLRLHLVVTHCVYSLLLAADRAPTWDLMCCFSLSNQYESF